MLWDFLDIFRTYNNLLESLVLFEICERSVFFLRNLLFMFTVPIGGAVAAAVIIYAFFSITTWGKVTNEDQIYAKFSSACLRSLQV